MISEVLKKLRLQHGYTLQQVADGVHVNQSTYKNYEYGRREPDLETVANLASFYKVSTDYLLGREPCSNPIEQLPVGEQDRAIVQAYINLSDKERTEFVEILRKIAAGAEIKMVISHEHKESEIYISKTAARNGKPPRERIRTQEEIDEIRSRPDADPDL